MAAKADRAPALDESLRYDPKKDNIFNNWLVPPTSGSKPPDGNKPKECQPGLGLGGLSDDELDDLSMYDIDRELYGDEAVGVGRTYGSDKH